VRETHTALRESGAEEDDCGDEGKGVFMKNRK